MWFICKLWHQRTLPRLNVLDLLNMTRENFVWRYVTLRRFRYDCRVKSCNITSEGILRTWVLRLWWNYLSKISKFSPLNKTWDKMSNVNLDRFLTMKFRIRATKTCFLSWKQSWAEKAMGLNGLKPRRSESCMSRNL